MTRRSAALILRGFAAAFVGALLLPVAGIADDRSPRDRAQLDTGAPAAARAQRDPATRKRVAVLAFEFGTLRRWWNGDWDLGTGISDLAVTELVRDGTYRVIERRAIDRVLDEQDFGDSRRVDPKTAARIGKVLGVDALIIGTITQFGFETKQTGIGAAVGVVFSGFGLGDLTKRDHKATVIIDARLIDASTGEVLAVAQGKGESRRGRFNAGAFGLGGGTSAGIRVDMGSTQFQETILGEATRKSVQAVCEQLIGAERKVVGQKIEVKGRVADVEGDRIIVNVGSEHGVRVGDVLTIERVVREVKDPDTGEVLRAVTEPVGSVRVVEVDSKSCVGRFDGSGNPKVGDRVVSK